jgi:hypothetical protein
MSAPNDVKLISAHDTLGDALDLVYAIDLIGHGIRDMHGMSNEARAITGAASLIEKRIKKAQRKIDSYREKDAAAKSAIAEPAATPQA